MTIPRAKHGLPLQSSETLDDVVLRGKQLFNDSSDPLLGQDGSMACAHCQLDGDSDRRVWNFTAGEGLRNTISTHGRGGTRRRTSTTAPPPRCASCSRRGTWATRTTSPAT